MRSVLFILCINLAEYIITQLHTVSTRSHRIWLVTLCCLCMKSSFCAELQNIYSCQNILLSSDSPGVSFYYILGKQIQHHLRGLFFSQYPNELSLIKKLHTLTKRQPAPLMSAEKQYLFCQHFVSISGWPSQPSDPSVALSLYSCQKTDLTLLSTLKKLFLGVEFHWHCGGCINCTDLKAALEITEPSPNLLWAW